MSRQTEILMRSRVLEGYFDRVCIQEAPGPLKRLVHVALGPCENICSFRDLICCVSNAEVVVVDYPSTTSGGAELVEELVK